MHQSSTEEMAGLPNLHSETNPPVALMFRNAVNDAQWAVLCFKFCAWRRYGGHVNSLELSALADLECTWTCK